jgi:hypothetical protein
MRTSLALAVLLSSILIPTTASGQQASLGELPLFFEANRGDFDSQVRFVARGRGYRLLVTDDGLSLLLGGGRAPQPGPGVEPMGATSASDDESSRIQTYAVRLGFVGASPAVTPVGEQPLSTRIHRLRGPDPTRWNTGIETFGALRFAELWPGIDLVLYDAGGELEYDLVVRPGADPALARFTYDGVDALSLDQSGRLHMSTPVGELVQSIPLVYQEHAGTRSPVPGAFELSADGSMGFQLGDYDRQADLVVDPLLLFATYLPGSGYEWTNGLGLGPESPPSIYLSGGTTSFDLPTAGGFQSDKHSDEDVFVARLAPDGRSLLWCTYLGGEGTPVSWTVPGDDRGFGLVVADTGAAIVCGTTVSDDFPVTPGAWDVTNPPGHSDGFVTRLAPDGASLEWSTFVGNGVSFGGTDQTVHAVDLGLDGSVYAVGQSGSSNFPVTGGSFGTSATARTGFVTRLAADGASVLWSGVLGATSGTKASGITDVEVDASGRAYLAGWTNSPSLPTTANAFDSTYNDGFIDGFVARISEDGSSLDYCSYLGSTSSDGGSGREGVACDDSGRVVFVSQSRGSDYPTTAGALQPVFTGASLKTDAVVTCIDTDASGAASLLWSTYLGGTRDDSAKDVCMDAHGNVHVMGWTTSSNFPVLDPIKPYSSYQQAFLTGLDPDGALLYSTWLGGSGVGGQANDLTGDESGRIALDALGDLYVVGDTRSPDLATTGAYVEDLPSIVSAFAAKLTLRELWVDLGLGLAGAAGTPELSGVGDTIPGSQVSVVVENGLPFGTACFVLGLTQWSTPCKGGVLVPQIDIIVDGLALDALGGRVDDFVWPTGVPAGTTFYMQTWIHDPSGPVDFTASNAMAVVAP